MTKETSTDKKPKPVIAAEMRDDGGSVEEIMEHLGFPTAQRTREMVSRGRKYEEFRKKQKLYR